MYSTVEHLQTTVAPAVKTDHAPVDHCPLHQLLLHQQLPLLPPVVSTTTPIMEKIHVSLPTLAIGKPVRLPLKSMPILTLSLPLPCRTRGLHRRIIVMRSVTLHRQCQFVRMLIIKRWWISGEPLGRKLSLVSVVLVWVDVGQVSSVDA